MTRAIRNRRRGGFTIIELMVALGIFLLVCGAAFTLLSSSQQRYRTDSQLLTSFQEARLGLDQIVRDVNDAGFPPPSYTADHGGPPPALFYASSPFAWSLSAGYSTNPCQIGTAGGGNCNGSADSVPGDFDVIIETNPYSNPQDPACAAYAPNPCPVQWIRYQLQNKTLMRSMVAKQTGPGADPDAITAANLAPFVQNVVNNAVGSPQMAQYVATYPNLFPGGNPVPVFQFTCDTGTVPQPCPGAIGYNSPMNIREVLVTLIVAAPLPDANTGAPRLVQLVGRGRRVNPSQ